MRTTKLRIALPFGLIAVGVVLLLANLGVLGDRGAVAWAGLFMAAGAVFLGVFIRDRSQWWAAIPGCALLGMGIVALLEHQLGAWSGSVFLGTIGLGFWLIYLARREQWWAIIPGGTLLTLAAVAGLTDRLAAGTFFLGLAATFGLVVALPSSEERQTWALIPAGVLALVGALVFAGIRDTIDLIWPAALIAVGGYLILRQSAARRR